MMVGLGVLAGLGWQLPARGPVVLYLVLLSVAHLAGQLVLPLVRTCEVRRQMQAFPSPAEPLAALWWLCRQEVGRGFVLQPCEGSEVPSAWG